VLWAVGPDRECRFMDMLVAQLQLSEVSRPAPPLAAKALDLMKLAGTRLAVATLPDKLFAPAFLLKVHDDLSRQIERNRSRNDFETRPDKKLETAFLELLLPTLAARSLTGRLDVKGAVELKAQCPDAEATKKLNASLDSVKASLDAFFIAQLEAADENAKKTFTTDLKGKWWSTKLTDGMTLTGSLHTTRKILALLLQAEMQKSARPRPRPVPMPMIRELRAVPMQKR
jgi:hypothetical protein